ncbi:MAG: arginyltransferase [Phycisphaerae bacterium]|jgi:arginine-tRNA-protein transferase
MAHEPRQPHASPVTLTLLRGEPHPCAYLPDRFAAEAILPAIVQTGSAYQRLMDLGFRRTGAAFYRPACPACEECRPIRVPVERFRLSRSQRRVLRRNHDVEVDLSVPRADDEHWALFQRYQIRQHDGAMLGTRDQFERFLCDSPLPTIEIAYRLGGRLVGVGIVDVCPASLSSVYMYFDPDDARRSLGVFSALCEIDECRRRGLPYWYIGYWVRGSRKMDYKRWFRPHELLGPDGVWREAQSEVT